IGGGHVERGEREPVLGRRGDAGLVPAVERDGVRPLRRRARGLDRRAGAVAGTTGGDHPGRAERAAEELAPVDLHQPFATLLATCDSGSCTAFTAAASCRLSAAEIWS